MSTPQIPVEYVEELIDRFNGPDAKYSLGAVWFYHERVSVLRPVVIRIDATYDYEIEIKEVFDIENSGKKEIVLTVKEKDAGLAGSVNNVATYSEAVNEDEHGLLYAFWKETLLPIIESSIEKERKAVEQEIRERYEKWKRSFIKLQ